MESSVQFNPSFWDDKGGFSTLHLSCLMESLLPLKEIKLNSSKDLNGKITKEMFQLLGFRSVILTGSSAEGFGLPSYLQKDDATSSQTMEMLSDVDALLMTEGLVSTDKSLYNPAVPESLGYFEYVEDSPGYVRICVVNPDANNDEVIVLDPVSNKRYLSLTKYLDAFCKDDGPMSPIQQGPAVTMSTFFSKVNPESGAFCDLVFAIPCVPWPKIADGWKKRVEGSAWVTPETAKAIVKDGCHVVAVPSKTSLNPEFEWRISFSASEGRLAQEAVTDHQRQCYIYMKILHNQTTKPKGILSSYMYKSVFLHCCEKLPVAYWKEFPGSCILYILETLLECLRRKHVPTYFLPENNLIHHLTEEEIQKSIEDVEHIRKDPLTPVLEFTDNKTFIYQDPAVPFRQLVAPLLEDMAAFENHKDAKQTLKISEKIQNEIQRFSSAASDEYGEMEKGIAFPVFREMIKKVVDIYNTVFKQSMPDVSLTQFFTFFRASIPDHPMEWIHLYEAVDSLKTEYPELATERGTLASLYHAANYLPQLSQEKKGEYLQKAEDLFRVIYRESGDNVIDYVVFLAKQNRLDYARDILEKFIAEQKAESTSKEYWYDYKLKDCLVEPLKVHAETNGGISGDGLSFAYFYLVYCLMNNKSAATYSADKAECVLKEFEEHYEKKQDSDTFIVLKYTKMLMDKSQQDIRDSLELALD